MPSSPCCSRVMSVMTHIGSVCTRLPGMDVNNVFRCGPAKAGAMVYGGCSLPCERNRELGNEGLEVPCNVR